MKGGVRWYFNRIYAHIRSQVIINFAISIILKKDYNEKFKEKYPNFKEIEDFFSTDLRTKFEMDKKSSAISSKFKNEVEQGEIKIDKETKENFFKLFNYLLTF